MLRFCVGVSCTPKCYWKIREAIAGKDNWNIDGVIPSEDEEQYTLFWYWAEEALVDELRHHLLEDAIVTIVGEDGTSYTEKYGDTDTLDNQFDFGIFFYSHPTVGQIYSISSSVWIEFSDHSSVLLTNDNIAKYRMMLVKELKVKLHGLTVCVFTN